MKSKSLLREGLLMYMLPNFFFCSSSLVAGCVLTQLIEHRVLNYLHITGQHNTLAICLWEMEGDLRCFRAAPSACLWVTDVVLIHDSSIWTLNCVINRMSSSNLNVIQG